MGCETLQPKLDRLEERVDTYNKLLETHIKRTDLLEEYIKDSDEQWKGTIDRLERFQENQQAFTLKMLAGIGTFIGILVPLMLKLLKVL